MVIAFDRPLRLATAGDPANHAIIGPDGRAVPIASVAYDPATGAVTLTTRQPLRPGTTYRVTVDGHRINRVADASGIPLAGKAGFLPGTSYVGHQTTARVAHAAHHPSPPKHPAHPRKKEH